MIYLSQLCCTCLKKGRTLEKLSNNQENSLSYHDKLLLLIPQVNIDEIKEVVYVCDECKTCIDNMYNFRNKCINNNTVLWKYITKLRLNKNGKFGDSIVLNRLNDMETHNCGNIVDNSSFIDFNNIDIKFEPFDDDINEFNNDQLLGNKDPLNFDIKEEIEIHDDLHENNSRIDNERNNHVKFIHNDHISLHTEIDIALKNERCDEGNNKNEYKNQSVNEDVNLKIEDNTISIPETYMNVENNSDENHSIQPVIDRNKINPNSSTTSTQFTNHNRTTPNKKTYKCKICNKSFTNSNYFKTHTIMHTGEKPHKCELCSKSFPSRYDLNRHLRTHTGEKPHKCNICNKFFAQLSHLHLHNRIHTGEKPFKCEICNKSFNRNFNLKIHSKIHTDDRPYKCEICGKCFIVYNCLVKHKKSHIDEKIDKNKGI